MYENVANSSLLDLEGAGLPKGIKAQGLSYTPQKVDFPTETLALRDTAVGHCRHIKIQSNPTRENIHRPLPYERLSPVAYIARRSYIDRRGTSVPPNHWRVRLS